MGRIHKLEGYHCKHKVEIKDSAFEEKVKVKAIPLSIFISYGYILLSF